MVHALRLKKDEETRLKLVSRKEHLNKTETMRDLLRRGFILYELEAYREGNLSLGQLAENLDLSLLEALTLVGKFNAHPRVPEDYLAEAAETARALFR